VLALELLAMTNAAGVRHRRPHGHIVAFTERGG